MASTLVKSSINGRSTPPLPHEQEPGDDQDYQDDRAPGEVAADGGQGGGEGVAEEYGAGAPDHRARDVPGEDDAQVGEVGGTGDARGERAEDGGEAAEEDGLAAVAVEEVVRLLPALRPDAPADAGLAQERAEVPADLVADAVAERGRDDGDGDHGPQGDPAVVRREPRDEERDLAGQDHADEDGRLGERQAAGDEVQPGAGVLADPLQLVQHAAPPSRRFVTSTVRADRWARWCAGVAGPRPGFNGPSTHRHPMFTTEHVLGSTG